MKYYSVNQDSITVNGNRFYINHSYAVPYERNDLYLQLLDEQTPASPDAFLEPELGSKLYADIDFEYNYYAGKYQQVLAQVHNEKILHLLPSLNAWLLLENEKISEEVREYMFTSIRRDGTAERPDRILSKDYFNQVEQTYVYYEESGLYSNLDKTIYQLLPGYDKVEFINKEVSKIYQDSDNKREMFPMFAKFKMTGVEKVEFCNLLEEYELDSEFIDFLVSKRSSAQSDEVVDFRYMIDEEERVTSSNVRLYRYNDFISHMESASDRVINEPSEDQTTCEYFESFLKSQVFKSKAKEMIDNMPTGMAYPVAFRIAKRDIDGNLISVHYFFNYTDLETFLFFDSQVAYRKDYTYVARVINMMKVRTVTPSNFSGDAEELVFVEEPYYREDIYILDSPPVAPDVELVTYRGIDNKVLIMFNQMVDKKVEVPEYINPSDSDYFAEQYKSQKIESGLPIIFESDDPADFEFFRLNKKPVEYQDFSNENYKVIKSNGAYSAAYEDTIVPNQTYYYMFRTQDINGFVSNPTPIYEFVLNKEGETLYPKIRIVDFAKPEPPAQKNKSFKKYIKIGLSPSQYLVPEQVTEDLTGVEGKYVDIGVSDDNILVSRSANEKEFRKFKFRIRSKNTGKLIDINVTFKKNKVIKA